MSPAPNFSRKPPPLWKELLAVLGFMLFLALVALLLAWSKGHLIWQV